ncbi:MAG TPA: peptide-methionine (S)-S-oxide reductase MsrA [Sphingomicrobium sp.]|nr:peptide-methionine (S)-S-oxide reductase MsrA [Sphingomicrobium sp.]
MSPIVRFGAISTAAIIFLVGQGPSLAAEPAVNAPAALLSERTSAAQEIAVFAGGCFWGVQGVFSHVKGVLATTAGYDGGAEATARYPIVSTGTTGHAESVRVVFDPRKVSYADLLRIYFSVVADPTQLNRQGPDVGTQYRSALFPQSAAQASIAKAYIAQLARTGVYPRQIVTRIESGHGFFAAESYHQKFMAKNPDYPYIVINDLPKVEALKEMFPQRWKA